MNTSTWRRSCGCARRTRSRFRSRARRRRRCGRSTARTPSILAIRCSAICATCRRRASTFRSTSISRARHSETSRSEGSMRVRLFSVVLLVFAAGAMAQDYPNRTVRVVVPFPPGGAPDLVGRTLANRLSERLGQPFVVENRTGAGGNIAAEAVAKAAPDGYTLLATSDGPLVINPAVYPGIPFNTLRDFAPIAIAASAGLVLMACPTLPVASLQDVLSLSKSRKLTYATSGYGSSQHVAGELLKDAALIDLTHVPYKGFGAAVGDAISCNVDLIFGAISTGIPHVRNGK